MSKKQKLIDKLKTRSRNFTYDEAETLLISLSFVKSNKGKTSGSRVVFIRGQVRIELHRPHLQKELKAHQLAKLLSRLEDGGLI